MKNAKTEKKPELKIEKKPESKPEEKADLYSNEELEKTSKITLTQDKLNTYKKEGVLTQKLAVNGIDTRKVVIQDTVNGYVGIASNQYRLVPHNRIIRLAYTVADELGIKLTPISQPAMKIGYKHLKDGSVISTNGGRMLACFTAGKDVSIAAGDTVKTGFTLVNSYDTSTSLITAPFTLRLNCMNQHLGFMHALKAWSGNTTSPMLEKAKQAWSNSIKLQANFKTLQEFMSRLRKRQTHTGLITEEMLATQIALNMELAVGFANDYKILAQIKLESNEQQVQNIVDSMPVIINKQLSCISLERANKVKEPKIKPIRNVAVRYSKTGNWNQVDYKSKVSQNDLFQEYTNILTHNQDVASTSMIRQLTRQKKLTSGFNFGNLQTIEVRR